MILIIIIILAPIITAIILHSNNSRISEFRKDDIGNLGYVKIEMGKFLRQKDWGLYSFPSQVKFKYYGGTWIFEPFGCKLWWVYKNFKDTNTEEPQYMSSWNHWRNDIKSIKYIMEHHPNLTEARRRMSNEDLTPKII